MASAPRLISRSMRLVCRLADRMALYRTRENCRAVRARDREPHPRGGSQWFDYGPGGSRRPPAATTAAGNTRHGGTDRRDRLTIGLVEAILGERQPPSDERGAAKRDCDQCAFLLAWPHGPRRVPDDCQRHGRTATREDPVGDGHAFDLQRGDPPEQRFIRTLDEAHGDLVVRTVLQHEAGCERRSADHLDPGWVLAETSGHNAAGQQRDTDVLPRLDHGALLDDRPCPPGLTAGRDADRRPARVAAT